MKSVAVVDKFGSPD